MAYDPSDFLNASEARSRMYRHEDIQVERELRNISPVIRDVSSLGGDCVEVEIINPGVIKELENGGYSVTPAEDRRFLWFFVRRNRYIVSWKAEEY